MQLVASCVGTLALLRIVEPHYGAAETVRFLLASLAGSGVLTALVVALAYYVTIVSEREKPQDRVSYAGSLLYAPICGFQGGLAALLVAVKQLVPDAEITLLRVLHFRAKVCTGRSREDGACRRHFVASMRA